MQELQDHNLLMEEGYIDAAAAKIHQKMSELRESDNERLSRRWIWELIQNANDCANPTVNIEIKNDGKYLEFKHDGKPFDYSSLMTLVTQISRKELEENDSTGKFGTGFITTHLLSETVEILGQFQTSTSETLNLNFELNRSAEDVQSVRRQVAESLEELKKIVSKKESYIAGVEGNFTTCFRYNIENANTKAIEAGIEDFHKSIYYVLAFVDSIQQIKLNEFTYIKKEEKKFKNFKVVEILKVNEGNTTIFKVLKAFQDDVEIAINFKREDGLYVNPFNDITPKLFSKFPLVGTESYFPVIINSSKFSVEEKRDGIFENSLTNKEIIQIAIKLYEDLLDYVSENNFLDMFNMCYIKKNSSNSSQNKVCDSLLEICKRKKMIISNGGDYTAFTKEDGKNIIIPFIDSDELIDGFWELINTLGVVMPAQNTYIKWTKTFGSNYKFEDLLKWISELGNIEKIITFFKSEEEMGVWFTKLYDLLFKYREGEYLNKYNVFLNQSNNLSTKFQELYIDDNIDPILLDILSDLGGDMKSKLFNKNIIMPDSKNSFEIKSKVNKDVAENISTFIRKILSEETKEGNKREEEIQKIFNKITLWFLKYPNESKILFLDIYENKHNLCTKEEIVEKFEYAERAKETLEKYNIASLESLNEILTSALDPERYFSTFSSEDLLVGLAIDNLDELSKNNSIESVKYLLQHHPNPTHEALQKVQQKIERSNRNVINHLRSLNNIYDVDSHIPLAKTVFGDIYKNNQKIKVVVRPSDSEMIILFFQSELDALDDNNYELWIDNGKDIPRQLTFGDILMTTGIRVIPLKALFTNE